ncbi:hypothetical protein [Nocardia yunnanensis]|nr:hypothetical protein [Nocardia yunnanensis]
MSDLNWSASNTVIVAALTTSNGDHELRWEHAVRYLPSVDTPAIHAWLDTHHVLEVIVVPYLRCPPSVLTAPHRAICVPPSEYALFTAALSTALAERSPWRSSAAEIAAAADP